MVLPDGKNCRKRRLPESSSVRKQNIKAPKFEGKKSDIEGFVEYSERVRTEVLEIDPFPSTIVLEALCREYKAELNKRQFSNLCLEQKCSKEIERIMEFMLNQVIQCEDKDEDRDKLVPFLDFYCHLVAKTMGEAVKISSGLYGSWYMERLVHMYLIARRVSLEMGQFVEEVRDSFRLLSRELLFIGTYSEGSKEEYGPVWELMDSDATYVLRKLFAVCFGFEGRKQGEEKKAVMDFVPCLDETMADECLMVILLKFAKDLWLDSPQSWRDYLKTKLYHSEKASMTLQVLLKILAAQDSSQVLRDEEGVEYKTEEIRHAIFSSLLPVWDNDDETKAFTNLSRSKYGSRILELGVQHMDSAHHHRLLKEWMGSRLDELSLGPVSNFMVQAWLASDSLRMKDLKVFMDKISWRKLLSERPGVLWRAGQSASRLGQESSQAYVDRLMGAFGVSDLELFWAKLLGLARPSPGKKRMFGDKGSKKPEEGLNPTALSIGQTVLEMPLEKRVMKKVREGFLKFLEGEQDRLVKIGQQAYLLQSCIVSFKGEQKDRLCKQILGIARQLAYHKGGSFLLGDLASKGNEETRIELKNMFKEESWKLMAFNFALFKALDLDNSTSRNGQGRFSRRL